MKIALGELSIWQFRTLCLGGGAVGLFALCLARGIRLRVPPGFWGRLALLSFFNCTTWNILSAYGLARLPAGRASILSYTMPLWTAVLSVWVLHERFTPRVAVGLGLGLCGLALLVGQDLVAVRSAPVGALAMIAAAVCWAIGIVLMKRYPPRMPMLAFTAWMFVIGGVPVFAIALLTGSFPLPPVSTRVWLAVWYNIIVAFLFCYWAFLRLVQMLPATVTGISSLIVPVVGVFSGMAMLGERPGWAEFAALGLIVGALGVVLLFPRRAAAQVSPAAE
jgi:drug/metabolite transporter (DMT)-like permease